VIVMVNYPSGAMTLMMCENPLKETKDDAISIMIRL